MFAEEVMVQPLHLTATRDSTSLQERKHFCLEKNALRISFTIPIIIRIGVTIANSAGFNIVYYQCRVIHYALSGKVVSKLKPVSKAYPIALCSFLLNG